MSEHLLMQAVCSSRSDEPTPSLLAYVAKQDRASDSNLQFTYDADCNRTSKTVTSGATSTTVKDVYQLGLIAYETDGTGTLLATFTDDSEGVPVSVQVGSDPATAPRYYYVYNGHGDVVALVDSAGATVASYAYDTFGGITSSSESFANGWTNPYRYDGRDRVRYDGETGLYWMSVRAYDPTIGRFLARDPLGRAPLFFADQPYVYAGNNPLVNVDPSGQRFAGEEGSRIEQKIVAIRQQRMRVYIQHGAKTWAQTHARRGVYGCANQVCVFQHHLEDAFKEAQKMEFLALLTQIVAYAVDWAFESVVGKVERIITLSMIAIQALPPLAGWLGGSGPIYDLWQKIAAGLSYVAGILTAAYSWYKTAGWLAQHAVDVALVIVQGAVGGLPGALTQVAFKLFGAAVSAGISAGAFIFWGQYNQLTAQYSQEQRMGAAAWCRTAESMCAGLPLN